MAFFVRLLAREECIDCFFSIVPPFFCHRTIERGAFTFIMKSLNESRKYFGTVSNYPFSILAAAKKKTFIDSHIRGGWKPYKNVTLWRYVSFCKRNLLRSQTFLSYRILILAYFTLYKCHIYEGMAVFQDIFCPLCIHVLWETVQYNAINQKIVPKKKSQVKPRRRAKARAEKPGNCTD